MCTTLSTQTATHMHEAMNWPPQRLINWRTIWCYSCKAVGTTYVLAVPVMAILHFKSLAGKLGSCNVVTSWLFKLSASPCDLKMQYEAIWCCVCTFYMTVKLLYTYFHSNGWTTFWNLTTSIYDFLQQYEWKFIISNNKAHNIKWIRNFKSRIILEKVLKRVTSTDLKSVTRNAGSSNWFVNSLEHIFMSPECRRINYQAAMDPENHLRIHHDFVNQGIRDQIFWQSKTLILISWVIPNYKNHPELNMDHLQIIQELQESSMKWPRLANFPIPGIWGRIVKQRYYRRHVISQTATKRVIWGKGAHEMQCYVWKESSNLKYLEKSRLFCFRSLH